MRMAALTCAAAALLGVQALAQTPSENDDGALTCGQTHVVVRGDTLQKLVDRVYGPDESYMVLYRANRAVIGRDPSQIEKGQVLEIPCLDETGAPIAPVDESADGDEDDREGAGAGKPGRSRLVSLIARPAWPPLPSGAEGAGEYGGGMVADIVRAALLREMPAYAFRIDVSRDGAAPLEAFLSDRAHDLSFAWLKPDCDAAAAPGAESQLRCERLAWSDPIFEQVVSYYTRAADAPAPSTHRDLFGKTVCRPAGAALFMLEARGLVPPDVALTRPGTVEDCFTMLTAGDVDVVVVASIVAEDAIRRLGAADQVAEQPQLAHLATMRAVARIDDPKAGEGLAALNAGLEALREDGAWFDIVERRLAAHAPKEAPPIR